ncbi:hypothetical protein GCM10027511_06570 [Hymenobacter humi]
MLLLLVLLLSGHAASAQIVHKKPARVKAENRRALRTAHRMDTPYKDSHLDVKPARLKRGRNNQPVPLRDDDGDDYDEVDYKKGIDPKAQPAVSPGPRRKKKV